MSDSENAATAPRLVSIEIAGMDVSLPLKFAAGHVLTENQAKVLDAAYQRQFTNNQNALAKSRAEALAKATTDAERAAKAPLTAQQIAALYADYEPNVGGTPRQSAMERIRSDAAWRFWTSHVKAHNDAVANGGDPVIAKAGKKPVNLPRNWKEKQADGTIVERNDRDALVEALLAHSAYKDRIQEHVDAIMAERGKDKPASAETVVAGNDLL